MKLNKNLVIGLMVVLVIAIAFFGIRFTENQAAEAERLRVEQERIAEEERLAEEARLEEEAKLKAEEEARLKAEEEARLAEEARLKAEEEARIAAEIEAGTWLIAKNGVKVYTDSTKAEVLFEKSRLDEIFVVEEVKDDADAILGYLIKESYEAEAVGYVDAKYLVKAKVDLISRPYDDVDYGYFEKVDEHEDNPRIKVRGIFLTGHTAGIESRVDELIKIADETDVNAFVIDVKDDNGYLLFPMEAAKTYCPDIDIRVHLKDVAPLIEKLKEHDIYLIARMVTFKSPKYAQEYPERAISYKSSGQLLVKDSTYWASPYDRELWAYNVAVAKEAIEAGFNEIQFDYVRFPDTGSKLDKSLDFRNTYGETKTKAIQEFLKYAYGEISPMGAYIAADVFGWTATSITDVGIGQHWEAITSVVDYMAPMMYPSHYGPGIFGFDVPNNHPYGTINQSIKDALARNELSESPAMLRPWIQDFSYYGVEEVKDQIRALKENGVDEYMLWNAANRYTVGALNND